jgi:hypothetical protein
MLWPSLPSWASSLSRSQKPVQGCCEKHGKESELLQVCILELLDALSCVSQDQV